MIKEIVKWNLSKNKQPVYLVFFVTNKCNSKCKTCFLWKNLNWNEKELSLEEIEKTSKSMDKLLWLHLSGGEPFLRDDLPQICSIFYKNNKVRNIGIPTNCLLPEIISKKTSEILKLCPDAKLNIILSLDGLENTHDKIRGVKGNFQKFLQTLKELNKIKSEFKNLSIRVCTVICDENIEEIPELMSFVKSLNVDFHGLGILRGNPKSAKLLNKKLINKIRDLQKEYIKKYIKPKGIAGQLQCSIENLLNDKLWENFLYKNKTFDCLAGKGFVVIESNGDVKFCELQDKFANLKDYNYNFKELWAKKPKNNFKDCSCTHYSFQMRNLVLNPKNYLTVIKKMLYEKR